MVLSRVGILGGTFDPIHSGHVEIALHARDQARLDRVIFVPASQPRLKPGEPSASAEQRLAMVQLAVDGLAGLEVSDVELRRAGPTQTVETLREMRSSLDPDDELFFILGLDVLARFEEWVKPAQVVELARLLAVSRPGYSGFDWERFYANNPYACGRVDCIDTTTIDISASELRARVAGGLPVRGLVPEPVEHYIRDHGLYGAPG